MKLVISETINGVVQVTEKESVVVISDFDTGASAVPLATVTSKGSLIVGTGNAAVSQLVVGANGTTLIADSSQVTGLRFGSPAGSFMAADAENRTLSANLTLTDADTYVQFCDPGGVDRDITLPVAGVLNHPYWIYNSADAEEVLTVKNSGGITIGVITRLKSALFVSSGTSWSAVVDQLTAGSNGWTQIIPTCTYASANSFTIPGDYRNAIQVGDKIFAYQTTNKFFVVSSPVTYTSPNSTVTVAGGTDYTLANAAISYVYYSHAANPMWFPQWFNWTPNITNMTVVGTPTYTGVFSVNGRTVSGQMELQATTSLASAGSTTYCPVPVTGAFAKSFVVVWSNDYAADMPTSMLTANGSIFFPAWTASARKMIATFTYEI